MTSENLVFMYGTLKAREPNHHRLYDAGHEGVDFVGHAVTENRYPLIIATSNNIPFLLLHDGTTGNQIVGEIYRVNEKTLKSLDEFECYPQIYDRQLVSVKLQSRDTENVTETGSLQCWLYGLSRFKASLLDLPKYSEYHSNGDHNRPFIPIRDDADLKDHNIILFDD